MEHTLSHRWVLPGAVLVHLVTLVMVVQMGGVGGDVGLELQLQNQDQLKDSSVLLSSSDKKALAEQRSGEDPLQFKSTKKSGGSRKSDIERRIDRLKSILSDLRESKAERMQQEQQEQQSDTDTPAIDMSNMISKTNTPAGAKLIQLYDKGEYQIQTFETTYAGVPVLIYRRSDVGVHVTENGDVITNGIVFIHGGGWLTGDYRINMHTSVFEAMSKHGIAFSIGYRLSRTAPFPGPFYDCVKATQQILRKSIDWSVPPDRFVIMGGSSGANLAVAVAMELSKDPDYPRFRYQIIMNPPLQSLDFNTPSYIQQNKNMKLSRRGMMSFWMVYALGERAPTLKPMEANRHVPPEVVMKYADRLDHRSLPSHYSKYILPKREIEETKLARMTEPLDEQQQAFWDEYKDVLLDPRYAPLMAESFEYMPPAILYAAQYDILRDDNIYYAHALEKDGVPVQLFVDKGGYHGGWWTRAEKIGLFEAIEDVMSDYES